MKKPTSSIDGFIPRRPGSHLGELHHTKKPEKAISPISRDLHTGRNTNIKTDLVGVARDGKEMGARDDLLESLRDIEDSAKTESKKQRRIQKKLAKGQARSRSGKPRRKIGKIIKWAAITLVVAVLGLGAYFVIKGSMAGGNVFKGNLFDAITKNDPLKQDLNGRSNFLIFGTEAGSDSLEHQQNPYLTDSIMVLSVDQEKKNAYMISLPRDLWVKFILPQEDGCMYSYQGKINEQFKWASCEGKQYEYGAEALSKTVGEVLGIDIQYYVAVNFESVVDAVDAVGGVDVVIETSDPRGILDRNFDWKCGYRCYYVNYKNGEKVHLDGEHALALARARNAPGAYPGYGLPNGNFDREKNQQKVLKALREKALSVGTLTNIGAVTGLIDAMGENIRTNIQAKEIRTILDIASKIDNDNIISLSLNDSSNMLVTTGMHNAQSIVRPIAGLLDYSEIQKYIKNNMTSDPFVREDPHVSVLNGSKVAGAANKTATQLEEAGFTIDTIGNAPDGNYDKIEIYQISDDKPATAAKLRELYGVTIKTTTPPASVVGETDFLIIIGSV